MEGSNHFIQVVLQPAWRFGLRVALYIKHHEQMVDFHTCLLSPRPNGLDAGLLSGGCPGRSSCCFRQPFRLAIRGRHDRP